MLRVKTNLRNSETHGMGLFADEFIPEGTVTWQYDPEFDTAYTLEEIEKMSTPAQKIFWHYAYLDKELNKYVLCADDQRFINHTNGEFNIQSTPRKDVAVKDIQPGEELLCNYNDFEDGYFDRREIDVSEFK